MVLEKTENIKISALGGVGELGKNMYVVEINENIYVLDAGSKFPGGEMLGIDIVIPDITYLVENQRERKRHICYSWTRRTNWRYSLYTSKIGCACIWYRINASTYQRKS